MHLMGTQVWLDDNDAATLRVLLSDDSFDEIAISIEQLQQIVDASKIRMQQPDHKQIAVAMFEIAGQLADMGIRL